MLGFKRIVIAEHERGIHLKEGSLSDILTPGVYRFWNLNYQHRVLTYDLNVAEFSHAQADLWLQQHTDLCKKHFQVVETTADQVALIYRKGHLHSVIEPDQQVIFWRDAVEIQIEYLNIREQTRVELDLLTQLQRRKLTKVLTAIHTVEVPAQHIALLFVNNEWQTSLITGRHAFWTYQQSVQTEVIDLRTQSMDVQGQEILSKDKVSLRINLSANYRVRDVVKARTELDGYAAYLYRSLQFALRQVVATRTLDELLGDKGALDSTIFQKVSAELAQYGIDVINVGVKDVILPGEMKTILNQVVEAEKIAQANVIRRREETAATRSLLNTAKLMDENPTLLRLKELETLEKVTDNIGSLTVYGGLDGVLDNLVRIKPH